MYKNGYYGIAGSGMHQFEFGEKTFTAIGGHQKIAASILMSTARQSRCMQPG